MKSIIIYDGDCGFCNSFLRNIAEKDIEDRYIFIGNQSERAKQILFKHNLPVTIVNETIVLIEGTQVYLKAHAIMNIYKNITKKKFFFLLSRCKLMLSVLNVGYTVFAPFRQMIVTQTCSIPDEKIKKKFV